MLGSTPAQAQETPSVQYDSSAVALRSVDAERLEAFREDPAFRYDREPPEAQSAWQRFWAWVREAIFGPLDDLDTGPLLRWLVYLLIAVVVVFAITRLLRMDAGGVFTGRRDAPAVRLEVVEEDIHGVDFDVRIEEAVAAQDYRRAVRLLYLRALQRLTDGGLIDWQRDKTNHEYIRELRRADLRRPLKELTYLFEYVWYGDFPVEAAIFERVRASFRRFDAQIQQGAPA